MSRPAAGFFLFCTFLLAAACDKVPLLAPTQSTLTLTVSTTTLPINGTAEVIATVIEQSGTPVHNGTRVTFTSSFGVMEPREAETQGGQARAIFRAGTQSGTAKIGAVSGAAKATELEVKVGGAAAERVSVRAEPSTVSVTGGVATIVAVVSDASGNPLPGSPVTFSADNGTLSSSGGITDQNGEVRTQLTTNRDTVVRASVGTKEGTTTVRAVTLPTVTISANPSTGVVGLPIVFTVTPGSATTGNAIQSVVLDFGDGTTPANLGAISGATSVSHVYTRADNFTVTATVTDIGGQRITNSAVISVSRPTIGVSFTSPPSTGQVGTQVSFAVAVSNPNNIPLQSLSVRFGDGFTSTLATTGGTVTHTYLLPGTFNVIATLVDQSGSSYTANTPIIIAPAAALPDVTLDAASADPAVSLSCVPASGYPKTCNTNFIGIGVRIQFTASSTFGVTGYEFNFGDGTVERTTSRTVDHVFRSVGEFIITVTVATSTGQTGTQRLTLIVSP